MQTRQSFLFQRELESKQNETSISAIKINNEGKRINNNMAGAANPPHTQKSKSDLHLPSLASFPHPHIQPTRDPRTAVRSRKNPASKWTLAVQTPVVPGASVKRESAGRLLEEGVTDVLKGTHWLPGAEWTRVEEGKACWETSWLGEQVRPWSR